MLHPGDVRDLSEVPFFGGEFDHRLDVSIVGEIIRNRSYLTRRDHVRREVDRLRESLLVDVRTDKREPVRREGDCGRLSDPRCGAGHDRDSFAVEMRIVEHEKVPCSHFWLSQIERFGRHMNTYSHNV